MTVCELNQLSVSKDRPAAHNCVIALRLRVTVRFVCFFFVSVLGWEEHCHVSTFQVPEAVLCYLHRQLMTATCAAVVTLSLYPVHIDIPSIRIHL